MKRFLYLSVVFCGLALIFVQCGSKEKRLHNKLQEMADNLNKSAPVMYDAYTQFDGAAASPDNVFRYYYTVKNTDNPKELIDSMKAEMESKLEEAFAINPDLQIFKENQLTIEYVYKDEAGNPLETIEITPDKYK
ncbi:MAG: hypothetical protein LBS52_10385 [Dysgonamonadaceae bacterium]|jgi:hypothetical protein|nr:hypothetical protein [Dysgonamonadaceae bacterium]